MRRGTRGPLVPAIATGPVIGIVAGRKEGAHAPAQTNSKVKKKIQEPHTHTLTFKLHAMLGNRGGEEQPIGIGNRTHLIIKCEYTVWRRKAKLI